MSRNQTIAEQVVRAGAVLRELELAVQRIDTAKNKLPKDSPLRAVAEVVTQAGEWDAHEKYGAILQRINSWLTIEALTITRVALVIEKENVVADVAREDA